MSGRPSGSSKTTSNGLPWGWNAGKVGSGFLYGMAVKKGIQATQRQGWAPPGQPQPQPSTMDSVREAGTVTLLWLLWVAIVVIQAFYAVSGLVAVIAGTADTPLTFPLLLVLAFIGWTGSFLAVVGSRALVANREHIAPSKVGYWVMKHSQQSEIVLWLVFFWGPVLLYLPLFAIGFN